LAEVENLVTARLGRQRRDKRISGVNPQPQAGSTKASSTPRNEDWTARLLSQSSNFYGRYLIERIEELEDSKLTSHVGDRGAQFGRAANHPARQLGSKLAVSSCLAEQRFNPKSTGRQGHSEHL
jgi:hypothetical protein